MTGSESFYRFLCIFCLSIFVLAPAALAGTISTEFAENRIDEPATASCQCGAPVRRIVNGEPAKINDIPWTVGLIRKESYPYRVRPFCGGTLINDRYVATASHCVDGTSAKSILVLLNEEDLLLSTETIGETRAVQVEDIIMHPSYNRLTVNNDIALLKLANPEPLGTNSSNVLVPACIPQNNFNDFSKMTATVAGWGTTVEGGSTSSSLQKVDVPIISNFDCNLMTKYIGRITDGMLCAGFVNEGNKDSCQGDSGGPLVVNNGAGRKILAGVVSWGFGCAQKRAPGVYTRVGKYVPWILANTKDANWCEGPNAGSG